MSKFKKLSQRIDALGAAVDEWPADVAGGGVTRREAEGVVANLESSGEELAKFVARAKETDPDRQLYGAKMCERVLALDERWTRWLERAQEVAAALPEDAAGAAGAACGAESGQLDGDAARKEREEEAAAQEARRKAIEAQVRRPAASTPIPAPRRADSTSCGNMCFAGGAGARGAGQAGRGGGGETCRARARDCGAQPAIGGGPPRSRSLQRPLPSPVAARAAGLTRAGAGGCGAGGAARGGARS